MDDDEVTELTPVPQERDTQVTEVVGFEVTAVAVRVAADGAAARPNTETDEVLRAPPACAAHPITETDVASRVPPPRLGTPRPATDTDSDTDTNVLASAPRSPRLGTPRPDTETTGVIVVSRRPPTEAEWPPSPREPASMLPPERHAAMFASVPDDELISDSRSPDDWH